MQNCKSVPVLVKPVKVVIVSHNHKISCSRRRLVAKYWTFLDPGLFDNLLFAQVYLSYK